MGYICGNGDPNPVYRNSMHGLISVSSPEHIWEDGVCTNCGTTQAAVWDATEQVYKIYNLVQLQWFADKVNAGEKTINGKLMADIDASSLKTFGIGTSSNKYAGIFDGNGYTITLGLNSTAQYAALFPYVNNATIKSLIVKGSITTNQKFAASIVGLSEGTTKIENCLSYVTITSTVSGDGTHGGLVANVSSGTATINNCGFVGAINGADTDSCGGLVGWSNGTTNISNSFVAATFGVKSDNGNTFSRGNNITVTNCYYLNALGGVPSGATLKSADQFSGGEVAWLLNGSDNGVWKQTISTDSYPNFSGGAVYRTTPCETGYTNNEAEKSKEHNFNEQGFCEGCNGYQPAVWNNTDGVYEISNAGQLLWFAGLVNGTLDSVEQNQSANAVLKNDLDMSGIMGYVPIGGTTGLYYSSEGNDKGYRGTFDGNGHVIKNLSVKGSDTAELTYGVFGTLSGTVKHLGVENFTFTLGSKDCRAGGIAGQILSGGLIENCYVANSTITATGKVAGGIAGCNYAGTIQNCFTYKVTVTATRSGGIVGDNRGDGGADDRKGTIINCYTDASAIESNDRAGNVATAKLLCADALEQLGYQCESGTWRNAYLAAAYELRNGKGRVSASAGNMMSSMTTEMLLDYISILFNGELGAKLEFDGTLAITTDKDTTEYFLFVVKNGAILYSKIDKTDVSTLNLSKTDLISVITGGYSPNEANIMSSIAKCLVALGKDRYKYFDIMCPHDSEVLLTSNETVNLRDYVINCIALLEPYLSTCSTTKTIGFSEDDLSKWKQFYDVLKIQTGVILDGDFFDPTNSEAGIGTDGEFYAYELYYVLYSLYRYLTNYYIKNDTGSKADEYTKKNVLLKKIITMLESYVPDFYLGDGGSQVTLDAEDWNAWGYALGIAPKSGAIGVTDFFKELYEAHKELAEILELTTD